MRPTPAVEAVLFDRDGTLLVDVPYNGDPAAVRPVPGARRAVDRVRRVGLPVGIVTNQSGLARGLFDEADLVRVHARVDELLGPFDVIEHCPHDDRDGCGCRKPRPGLVLAAAARLGVDPGACLVVGDTAADLAAAEAAGAIGVLVPNERTLPDEVRAAARVARDLDEAVTRWALPARTGPVPARTRPRSWGHDPNFGGENAPGPRGDGRPVLVARLDSAGDVLLSGPAVRAVARDHPVVMVAGPLGAEAGRLLPGVDDVIELAAPWVLADPPPVDRGVLDEFIAEVAVRGPRAAAILTSSHQSPLPLALALRLAGVPEIAGISVDYPGSLLDHRIPGDPDVHEVTRALGVVGCLGHHLPDGDDRLAVTLPPVGHERPVPDVGPYVVVHPGASAEARTLSPERWQATVAALGAAGRRVVVTGSAGEAGLTAAVAGGHRDAVDLGGAGTLADLAAVLAGADAVVCGNTGPTHLAAAVGTPVAAVFPPTVPLARWRPWRVPHVVLGDQDVPCRGCRSRRCEVPGQPCLAPVTPDAVVDAVARLADAGAAVGGAIRRGRRSTHSLATTPEGAR